MSTTVFKSPCYSCQSKEDRKVCSDTCYLLEEYRNTNYYLAHVEGLGVKPSRNKERPLLSLKK